MKPRPKIVTVFGSSRPREGDAHYAEAQALGAELAARGFVVCSGGYGGVMEAVSRGAKDAGGRTLGVTARSFKTRANQWVDDEIRVKSWQDRLFKLVRLAHAYVACPGGTGTLAELAVVWEMVNKSVMPPKPVVSLGDFWSPVIARVREVELGQKLRWGEQEEPVVREASSPSDAAAYLAEYFATLKLKTGGGRRGGQPLSW